MVARQDETPFRLPLLLILLALISGSAAAASLNLLPAPSAPNASHSQPHEYYCNSLPSWTGGRPGFPTYQIDDCDQAIAMFEQDVARNPGRAQWLSLGFPHAVPGYGTPVWTPKRYTFGKLPTYPLAFGGEPELTEARGQGTCVLAIASLLDVGDVPSKPKISGGGTMGVIATWRAVSEYVEMLSEACLVRGSELGWTAYGKQPVSFTFDTRALEAGDVAD